MKKIFKGHHHHCGYSIVRSKKDGQWRVRNYVNDPANTFFTGRTRKEAQGYIDRKIEEKQGG